jgi:hypothetical protein
VLAEADDGCAGILAELAEKVAQLEGLLEVAALRRGNVGRGC